MINEPHKPDHSWHKSWNLNILVLSIGPEFVIDFLRISNSCSIRIHGIEEEWTIHFVLVLSIFLRSIVCSKNSEHATYNENPEIYQNTKRSNFIKAFLKNKNQLLETMVYFQKQNYFNWSGDQKGCMKKAK